MGKTIRRNSGRIPKDHRNSKIKKNSKLKELKAKQQE